MKTIAPALAAEAIVVLAILLGILAILSQVT